MLNRILNYFGYYKIKQLTNKCHCGLCGKPIYKITPIESGGWDMCKTCEKYDWDNPV